MTFEDVFKQIKVRLIKETADVLKHKQSTTIRLGIKFDVMKINIDPFKDEGKDAKKAVDDHEIKEMLWIIPAQTCTKANINNWIDKQHDKLNFKFDHLNEFVQVSGWMIQRWHYIFVDCYTTKPQRGSSCIPTPIKYSNARCG